MWDLWQHILLGIVVGLCASDNTFWVLLLAWGASDNTLYWALLWVMRGFEKHTLLCIMGLMWGAFINGFKIIYLIKIIENSNCRFPYLLRNCWNQITCHCFPVSQLTSTNEPQSDKSHIHKLAPSPNRPEDGYMLHCSCIYFGKRLV
jgi:hypothetical protein